jgi:hypothetical protein|tara:strand:+ start:569 stop:838 length:270 start_codon:yes stop_codon:yes gene_type:complete
MTKKDSERKKVYSNQPALNGDKGKFNIGFFTPDDKLKFNPDENVITTFKEIKSELDPNITYQKKLNKDTKLNVGISSKGKGFIKIKKVF